MRRNKQNQLKGNRKLFSPVSKKIIALGVMLVMGSAVFFAPSVFAQEQTMVNVEYVVQPGDTLTQIATRFDVDLAALTNANGITNANSVNAGAVLTIPGVDWVSGLLDVENVPLGETFRSLQRRYQLDDQLLARISGVVSPSQVYAGYPLMLPSGIGEDLVAARAGIGTNESLLSLAARTGANPWSLVGANQLSGIWTGMKGDVLLLPGTNQPGPGALPSPLTVEVTKGDFIQGKTTVIEVGAGGQTIDLSGRLVGMEMHFMPYEDNYVALQGVHVMTDPGPYPFTLKGKLADGSEFEFSQMVRVQSGDYESERITVDPAYLDPTVDNAELAFIKEITRPVTPEKLWSGYFEKPTPFDIYINSLFGTRRSYNGSDYTYFHSGIDFGGGAGADVICPANGKVVYTGTLEIRGNATIIDHGWGIYTGYWHQSEVFVQVGDTVTEGQVIGLVGNTGRSSGAHLHWEVWAGGVQVEPYDWLIEQYP
jgi:murein DD-endopeptidase MepM/ murein hydrolase activator NlpD